MSRVQRFEWSRRQRSFRSQSSPRLDRRLRLEPLEDRLVLATFVVNSDLDGPVDLSDSVVTLRDAIDAANNDIAVSPGGMVGSGADTITFDGALDGTTITLGGTDLDIIEALTIDATSLTGNVTIDANLQSRILNIDDPMTATENFDVTLAGLTLTGGRTTANSDRGGAIRSETSGILTIDQSTVSENSTGGANASGGGVFANGSVTLTESTVSGNSTAGNSAVGGGILAFGSVTLNRSTVSGNSTGGDDGYGGGIFSNLSVILTQSTVSGNSTVGSNAPGAGIVAGSVILTQSTVTDNHANHASSTGGGIWNYDSINFNGSIVAGNTAGGGDPDLRPGTGSLTVNYSLIGDGDGATIGGVGNVIGSSSGSGVIGANLGPLQNNGGTTETHALMAGSPAINAGDPGFTSPPNFDQRGNGFDRILQGRIDIGAIESDSTVPDFFTVSTTADELDGDYSSGNLSLREAVFWANFTIGADTITFASPLFDSPQTITLSLGELTTTDSVTITGPGESRLTIDGNNASRIFNVDDGLATDLDVFLSDMTLQNGRIASGGFYDAGGAIFTRENLTITRSTIADSTSVNGPGGGGIYKADSSSKLMLIESTVSGNSATNSARGGGGIYLYEGSVEIIDSTISGNTGHSRSNGGGGGISQYSGSLLITGSTISGNTSINYSYSDNFGGGGIGSQGPLTIRHSTIVNNTALNSGDFNVEAYGGGILGGATLENTLVAGNTAADGGDDLFGSFGGLGYNLIGDGDGATIGGVGNVIGSSSGSGVIGANLGPLQNNGGTTETHALMAGSPAINAGDPGFTSPPNFDQRGNGFDRILQGRIDIGAIESDSTVPDFFTVSTTADELDGDYSSGNLSLREAVFWANFTIGADTITFASPLFDSPQTITLSLGELTTTDSVTITGPGESRLTIDGNNASRIFNVDDGLATDLDVFLSDMTLQNGRIASGGFYDAGGAIFTRENLTITRSTIADSTSVNGPGGGGIYKADSSSKLMLIESTVSGNSATNSARGGGGIYLYEGSVEIIDSTISGNTGHSRSNGGGGGISQYSGSLLITGSTISGNTSINYSYSDNFGGGGIGSQGPLTIRHSTIVNNTALNSGDFNVEAYGGGILGGATLENTLVAGNTAADGGDDLFGSFGGLGYNLIGDGDGATIGGVGNVIGSSSGSGVIGANLGPLQNNGGTTETHALMAGSPAIDAGDSGAMPGMGGVPLFDQRGNNYGRVQNGRIDIGAFEVRDTPSADFDSSGFITGFDFLAWQRGFGTTAPGATKPDGDADNDQDTDGNDLDIWESQFGQPAPAVAATSSLVVESSLAAEPSTAFQVEVTATLSSEEPLVSSLTFPSFLLPANLNVRPNDPGLGFRFTAPRQVLVGAEHPSAEHIDEAFRIVWHSWPKQNFELASDDFVHATHSRSAKATQPADKAFAELADNGGFVGLGPRRNRLAKSSLFNTPN